MLSPTEGFVPLQDERRLWASSPRASLILQSLNKYPGKEPFSVSSSNGMIYLTNRRVWNPTILPLSGRYNVVRCAIIDADTNPIRR